VVSEVLELRRRAGVKQDASAAASGVRQPRHLLVRSADDASLYAMVEPREDRYRLPAGSAIARWS
jgi:hypothetical protein